MRNGLALHLDVSVPSRSQNREISRNASAHACAGSPERHVAIDRLRIQPLSREKNGQWQTASTRCVIQKAQDLSSNTHSFTRTCSHLTKSQVSPRQKMTQTLSSVRNCVLGQHACTMHSQLRRFECFLCFVLRPAVASSASSAGSSCLFTSSY